MRIFQFIDEYCADIIKQVAEKKSLIDMSEFPHDEIITDAEGRKFPAILVDGVPIPINDLFTMERADFIKEWNLPSAAEAFDNYLSNIEILEGAEAVAQVRVALQTEMSRIAHDAAAYSEEALV